MIIISHRANTNGPNTAYFGENHPSSIKYVLSLGFNVEIDVRYLNNKFVLGHDKAEYEVGDNFFYNDRMWVHCKNIEALEKLISNPLINAFYHDKDDCVLTSQGFIWTYPDAKNILTSKSIAVMIENVDGWDLNNCAGVCTDLPFKFK